MPIIMRSVLAGVLILMPVVLEAMPPGAANVASKGLISRLASKVGYGFVLGSASLFFICTQPGCGGDELEAGESAGSVVEMVAPDSGIEVEKPYVASDYLGRYVVYISDGEGRIDSGLVVGSSRNMGELIVIDTPQRHVQVRKQDEFGRQQNDFQLVPVGGQVHDPIQTVIGVMDIQHDDVGALVEFDPADARLLQSLSFAEPVPRHAQHDDQDVPPRPPEPDDFNAPTLVRGNVSAVYVDPIHTSEPSVTFVNVIVELGFSADEWRRLWASSAFVPYDVLTVVE